MLPRVSIVMSTYNRSNILQYSIGSVIKQTIVDWELIVVGDACTDDTESIVHRFNDDRIRFINLTENFGEQSEPNNIGVNAARAGVIAFLNHDDLWFCDHLETCLIALDRENADLVFSWSFALDRNEKGRLIGLHWSGHFEPRISIGASSWVFKRSLFQSVGPWRHARDLINLPSQDWLYRAWRQKAAMISTAHLTCVFVMSGDRKGSYSNRDFGEHAALYQDMQDPVCRAKFLERAIADLANTRLKRGVWPDLRRFIGSLVWDFSSRVKLNPASIHLWWRFRKKGGAIARLRSIRGLEKKEGL